MFTPLDQKLKEKKEHKFQISEGCILCMYNINEQCELAKTPDACGCCPKFVNGPVTKTLTGK